MMVSTSVFIRTRVPELLLGIPEELSVWIGIRATWGVAPGIKGCFPDAPEG